MKEITIFPGLKLVEEKEYRPGSVDNIRKYEKEFRTSSNASHHVTAYGIEKKIGARETYPLIILGYGGASTLTQNSWVVRENKMFVAIDDSVVAVELSTIDVLWTTKVDFATCFGIFWVEKISCFISWGEQDISRIRMDGIIDWSVSGRDIFSEEFSIKDGYALATDFERTKYRIEIETGKISIQE